MNKIIPIAFALLVIIALCGLEGKWTGRFGEYKSELLDHFTQAVKNVPQSFEDWEGGEDNDSTKDIVLQEAGAVGHLSREYSNHAIGEKVSLYYICGPSHKVAIHAPTACYPGSGYTQEGEERKYSFTYPYIDKEANVKYLREAEFFTTVFSRGAERVRVFWSWNDGTRWEAPTSPRSRYSGLIPLNKCYLITRVSKDEARNAKLSDMAVNHFARLFLSYVDGALLKNGQLPFSKLTVSLEQPIDINSEIDYDTPEEGDQKPIDKKSSSITETAPASAGLAPASDSGDSGFKSETELPKIGETPSETREQSDALPGLDAGTPAPPRSLKTLDQTLPGIGEAVTPEPNTVDSATLPGL